MAKKPLISYFYSEDYTDCTVKITNELIKALKDVQL